MKSRLSICWSKLGLLLLATSTSVLSSNAGTTHELPTAPESLAVTPSTNSYHLSCDWGAVTNATGYQIIVRYSGIETQRVSTATNWATVSNLTTDLDNYRFSCVATNSAGVSDESAPAALHWMTVLESDSLTGPWTLLATNSFAGMEPQHWITLSNWSAASLLKKD